MRATKRGLKKIVSILLLCSMLISPWNNVNAAKITMPMNIAKTASNTAIEPVVEPVTEGAITVTGAAIEPVVKPVTGSAMVATGAAIEPVVEPVTGSAMVTTGAAIKPVVESVTGSAMVATGAAIESEMEPITGSAITVTGSAIETEMEPVTGSAITVTGSAMETVMVPVTGSAITVTGSAIETMVEPVTESAIVATGSVIVSTSGASITSFEEQENLILLTVKDNPTKAGALLEWSLSEDLQTVSYKVIKNGNEVGFTNERYYEDEYYTEGVGNYTYQILAYDKDYNQVAQSNEFVYELKDLIVSSDITLTKDMVVDDLVVRYSYLDLNGYTLEVKGNVSVEGCGSFYLNNGYLWCHGSMMLAGSSTFNMEKENDYVLVEGDFVFWEYWGSNLKAGTLEIKGNFTQKESANFASRGTHKTILSGTAKQVVTFEDKWSSFNILELKNNSEEGIYSAHVIPANDLIRNNTKITYDVAGDYGWVLSKNQIIEGDLYLVDGTLDLNGYTLTIKGNLVQAGGKVEVNEGSLVVCGDYRLQEMTQNGANADYTYSIGKLCMDSERDHVLVEGNFVIGSNKSMDGYLTAGTLEVRGDLIQINYVWDDNFVTTGSCKLLLSGDALQTVTIEGTSNHGHGSYISNLEITNTSQEGIVITNGLAVTGIITDHGNLISGNIVLVPGATITGGSFNGNICIYEDTIISQDLHISGDLSIGYGTINLNGHSLNVDGNITINGGRIKLNQGTLLCKGNLKLTYDGYLVMQNLTDYVVVCGDFIAMSYDLKTLTAGILEVKGNFYQNQIEDTDNYLTTSGTHKIILSGDSPQTIIISSPLSKFNIIELKNTSTEGVYAPKGVNAISLICNNCKFTTDMGGTFGWNLVEDEIYEGDLHLISSELNLNGHQLTVHGDLVQSGGTINVNGGTLIITGDYRMQSQKLEEGSTTYEWSSGVLLMTKETDKVQVNGDFVMASVYNHESNLINGILEVKGDITQITTSIDSNLTTSNHHNLLLSGDSLQTITFDSTSSKTSRIANLVITNASQEGIVIKDGLAVTGTVTDHDNKVNGFVILVPGATILNNSFQGSLRIDEDSRINQTLVVKGDFNIYGRTTILQDLFIGGNFNVLNNSRIDINGHNLYVAGNVKVYPGSIYVNKGRLECKGNLTLACNYSYYQSYYNYNEYYPSYLSMIYPEDYILVHGDFITEAANHYSYLTAGTLEIKGNFVQKTFERNFSASGTHKTVFSGDTLQTISFSSNSSYFNLLELKNTSKEGVCAPGGIYTNFLIRNQCKLDTNILKIYGQTLENDEVFEGNLCLISGEINLNGHKLTVNGDLIQEGGTIRINGGSLIVTGDYRIHSENKSVSSFVLVMTNSNDRVLVNGDFVMKTTLNHDGYLTNGILEVKGDFSQIVVRLSEDLTESWISSYSHKILLSGQGLQTVNISRASYGTPKVANLEITNTSKEGVVIATIIVVTGTIADHGNHVSGFLELVSSVAILDNSFSGSITIKESVNIAKPLTVTGDMYINANTTLSEKVIVHGNLFLEKGKLDLNGRTLVVDGDLTVNSGEIYIHSGLLVCKGKLTLKKSNSYYGSLLTMSSSGDYVTIYGDFIMESPYCSTMSAGVLELKSGFYLENTNFVASGAHTVMLSGNQPQTVSFGTSLDSCFNDIVIKNTSGKGVRFHTYVTVKGKVCDLSKNVSQENYLRLFSLSSIENHVYSGSIILLNSTVLDADYNLGGNIRTCHDLDIAGFNLSANSLYIQGGTCNINNGSIKLKGNLEITDNSNFMMTNDSDLVIVDGDFKMSSIRNHSEKLSAGTLEVKGDFTQSGYDVNFLASGTHRTILSGKVLADGSKYIQTVRFSYPGSSRFNQLVLTSTLEKGYNFISDINLIANKIIYDNGDIEKPLKVEGLTLTETSPSSTRIEWEASKDNDVVDGYEVYRDGVKVTTTKMLCFEDIGLEIDKLYTYTVCAFDLSQNLSEVSEEVSITLVDREAPSVPTSFKLELKTGTTLTLSWAPSSDNVKTTGYEIYRNGAFLVKLGIETTYKDTNLIAGEKYTYQLRAFDASGNLSECSATISGIPQMPSIQSSTPSDYSSIGGLSTTLTLIYKNVGNSTGNKVKFEYQSGDGEWKAISDATVGQTYHNSTQFSSSCVWNMAGLKSGEYIVRYTLYDSELNQDVREVTYDLDQDAPKAVQALNVVSDNGLVELRWQPSTSSDCKEYRIYRASESDHNFTRIATLTDAKIVTYIDATATIGNTYLYQVTAVDNYSQESIATESASITIAEDQKAPVIKSILPTQTRINGVQTVTVTAADNLGVASIMLEVKDEGATEWTELEQKVAKNNTCEFTWNTTNLNGVYILRATAIDGSGNQNTEEFVRRYEVDNTGIAKIRISEITSDSSYVSIRWEDVAEEDFSYFQVEQKVGDHYETAGVEKNTLGMHITGLHANTNYIYRVVGYDNLGNRGIPSDEVTIHTKSDTTLPVITAIYPKTYCYQGIIALQSTVSDNIGASKVSYSYSYDKINWTLLTTVSANSIQTTNNFFYSLDTSIIHEGNVYIKVVAYDEAGNSSTVNGEDVCITYIIDRTAPAKVGQLVAKGMSGYVSLTWNQGKETDIAGYRIYRAEEHGDYKIHESLTQTYNYYDRSALYGKKYQYKVAAVDLAGNESEVSNESIASVLKDSIAPEIYGMDPQNGGMIGANPNIRILVGDNVCVKELTLEYKLEGKEESAWTTIDTVAMNEISKLVEITWNTELLEQGTYLLSAYATDLEGNKSKVFQSKAILDKVAPQTPVIDLVQENWQIKLTWDQAKENDFASYKLYRKSLYESDYVLVNELKETQYIDKKIVPEELYTYKIQAYDKCGNYSESTEVQGFAYSEDTISPVANTSLDLVGIVGMEVAFDGSASSDNVRVTEFIWDLGNGEQRSGARFTYAYAKPGEYKVTLTVKDAKGNRNSININVKIYDQSTAGTVKVKMVNSSGVPMVGACLNVKYSEFENRNFVSDSEGIVTISADAGKYQIVGYKQGYLPTESEIILNPYDKKELTLQLSSGEIVVGNMTARRMSLEEMINAGVDLSNINNYLSYSFRLELTFEQEPLPVYIEYNIIGNSPKFIGLSNPIIPGGGSGGSAEASSGGYSSKGYVLGYNTEEGPILAFVRDQHIISWMKEAYEINLTILNNASKSFVIEDASATIQIPDGMSLLGTHTGQTNTIDMGDIWGQEKKSVSWYLGGDKPGTYDVSASFHGILQPFEAEINAVFKTQNPIEVSAGNGINICVYPEESAYLGKDYYIQYSLTNNSDHPIYNLMTSFGNYVSPGYVEEHRIIDEETGEEYYEPYYGEDYTIVGANMCSSLPITRDGDTILVKVLMPGESIYGTYKTLFEGEGDPEKYYYKLIDSLVTTLSGENTGVEVEVMPIPSHITKCTTKIITIDNSWADPVDMSSGAFTENMEAIAIQGATSISLDLDYNSQITDTIGAFGKGWSHNYETSLKEADNGIRVYWSPSSYSTFIRKEAVELTVYGTIIDNRIALSKENKTGEQEYICISSTMQNATLKRHEDGTYTLTLPSQNIYRFDSNGRLIQMVDPAGKSIDLIYSNQKLIVEEKKSGKQLIIQYNENGRITSVEDSTGRRTSFAYQDDCLTKITNPLEESISYSYDEKGRIITGKNNHNETYLVNTYDKMGRVLTQDDGNDKTPLTKFQYSTDQYGRVTTNITDRNGNTAQVVSNRQGEIISTTNQIGDQIMNQYDYRGKKVSSKDAMGYTTWYEYDDNDNLTSITDAYGNTTTMTYDVRGNVLTVSGSDGVSITSTYDERSLLTSKKDAAGLVTTYTYNDYGQVLTETIEGLGTKYYTYENGMLISITDYKNNVTKMSYDEMGNIKSIINREGIVTEYENDKLGRVKKVKNALDEITEYDYDINGNQVKITDALGKSSYLNYDATNILKTSTDAMDATTTYISDAEGRLLKKINPDETFNEMVYDAAGNLLKQIDEEGQTYEYTYNKNGKIETETTPSKAITKYEYYPNGKLYRVTSDDGNWTIYSYDKKWRLTQVSDTRGHYQYYEYDKVGNKTLVRDTLGNEYRYEYDIFGRMTKSIDPMGYETKYDYDANGNCTFITNALNQVTEYVYDKEDRVKNIIRHGKEKDAIITYQYDVLGRVNETIDEEGNSSFVTYDQAGNVESVKDAYGNILSTNKYNANHDLTEITDVFGNITINTYDNMGNLKEILLKNQEVKEKKIASYTYDNLGRIKQSEDTDQKISKCEYDKDGNLVSIINPNGGVTSFEYDKYGRILSEVNGASKKDYKYNASGLLAELNNGREQTTSYEYDAIGRITSFTDEVGTVAYTYDKNSNILTVTDSDGSIKREYDKLNRVSKYTDYHGNIINYGYDELGNLISIEYPGGKIVRYSYYLTGNLYQVTDWNKRVTTYTYDKNGNLSKVGRPDGSEENYAYDIAGKLVLQEDKIGSTVIQEIHYTYDKAGNIIKKTSKNDIVIGKPESASGLETVTMTYDKSNRLLTYNGVKILYDADGNMTYGPLNGVMTTFTYDCRNRLIQAGNLTYEYDAENNRTAIVDTKANVRTEFVTDTICSLSQLLIATEYKLTKAGTKTGEGSKTYYIYGCGLIAQEDKSQGYITYHFDNLGSTTAITDHTGKVLSTYSYGTYGELLSGEAGTIRFLYNGRYGVVTDTNGLYYMRARYYNVDIKRFLNQDVIIGNISQSSSLNRYSYVQGNPVSLTDPFGLFPIISWKSIGHSALDVLGFIPVVGDACDLVNAYWYYQDEEYEECMMSVVSALPGIGSFVGKGIKWGGKAFKSSTKVANIIELSCKTTSNAVAFARGSYRAGVTAKGIIVDHILNGEGLNADLGRDLLGMGLDMLSAGLGAKGLSSNFKVIKSSKTAEKFREVVGRTTNRFGIVGNGAGKSGGKFRMNLQFFADKGGSDTTRVGRWMSESEYQKMADTGYVQKPYNADQSYVANPASYDAFYKQAPKGSVYVEFDVTASSIRQTKDIWATIPGPNSLYSKLQVNKGLPPIDSFPKATNIVKIGVK